MTQGAHAGVLFTSIPSISGSSSGIWIIVVTDIIRSNRLRVFMDRKNSAMPITRMPLTKLTVLPISSCRLSSDSLPNLVSSG